MSYFEIRDQYGLWEKLEEVLRQYYDVKSKNFCDALFEHIKHGDEKHQEWLKKEIEYFRKNYV